MTTSTGSIRARSALPLALAVAAVATLAACGAAGSSSATAGSTTSATRHAAAPAKKATPKPAVHYPDPVAWGRKQIKEMAATSDLPFVGATIAAPGTDTARLDVATPLYDKESNRGSGAAMGLCVVFTDYARSNHLSRVVIHASDSAPLISTESTDAETWSRVIPAWTCHAAG